MLSSINYGKNEKLEKSVKEIFQQLGISKDAYYKYIKKYPDFSDASKRGSVPVNIKVKNAFLDRCFGVDYDALNVRLDSEQRKILEAMQHNARVSVHSETARGKDYVTAVAALCFLFYSYHRKFFTALTDRQANDIMMREISIIHTDAKTRNDSVMKEVDIL